MNQEADNLKESVMIVNSGGRFIGTMDKIAAHRSGMLHRAFSIFIFNSQGQLLLQQRALNKYHSGGLWTNTCCSHPKPGETMLDAAHRRLVEEMGIDCELYELFQFTYRHEFENGLIENEYDHVLIGISDEIPEPNVVEVADIIYLDTELLKARMSEQPDLFTAWFKICLDKVLQIYFQTVSMNLRMAP